MTIPNTTPALGWHPELLEGGQRHLVHLRWDWGVQQRAINEWPAVDVIDASDRCGTLVEGGWESGSGATLKGS